MKNYIAEIKIALNAGLYTLAITSALALPDICACLESSNPDNRQKVGRRYMEWYKRYAEKNCLLSPEICYKYRCSMIHNKKSKIDEAVEKVAFFLPDPNQPSFNNCYADLTDGQNNRDKAIIIDVNNFVNGMIKSVEDWLEAIKDNPHYIKNNQDLLQIRPNSTLNLLSGGLVIY